MGRKISFHVDGGRPEGLVCADPGAMTPSAVSGNFEFPLTPTGVLALGSVHARPSARLPSTCAEIFQCICLGGGGVGVLTSFSDHGVCHLRQL